MNRFASIALVLSALGCSAPATAGDAGTDGSVAPDAGRDTGPTHDAGADAPIDVGSDAPASCTGVTCTASDACHAAGTCDPGTGTCSHPTVMDGTTCSAGAGSISGVCIGGTCLAVCGDGRRDGTESDIDCGGTCATCGVGGACNVDGDCTTGVCDATNRCARASCTDGRRNGTETGIDCGGGGTCATCAVGGGCALDSDCASNACNATSLTCVTDQCADARRDGVETDVDCGGGTCAPCAVGRACNTTSDCVAGRVCSASHTCA